MRFLRRLVIGLGIAAVGSVAGSVAESAIARPLNTVTVSAPQGHAPAKGVEAYAMNKDEGYGYEDISNFCASVADEPLPEPGIQYDGQSASEAVLTLVPGRYDYPNGGALLLFPERSYLMGLPTDREGIFGTDGSDLLAAGGIVGGCNMEQLSEAIANNSLDVDTFTLVRAYE